MVDVSVTVRVRSLACVIQGLVIRGLADTYISNAGRLGLQRLLLCSLIDLELLLHGLPSALAGGTGFGLSF